ncbi:hypothetical protein [Flavobacterium sp. YJ01]|uniref:toxin-antitoxin system YwqK family antitoxin n=1 Tax=unclassified Flavobacterium TaxID=196869 RepID=UPI0023E35B33|nr:hypothetical protein [Flavobacterium sp. YJ01]WET03442.1 hypothetical protein P0R33_03705 [Flavobacterium sp. YJ01]
MKFLFSILSFVIAHLSFSQTTTFYDTNWKVCEKKNAAFYRVVSPSANLFEVKDYYINNTLQMAGYSTKKDSLIKQGKFNFYNDKGILIETTQFVDNIKQGKSFLYFDNGQIKRATNFVNDAFNGETIYYNSNGIMIGKGLAKDNYWYGKWEKYNDDGSFMTNIYYDDKYSFDEISVKASTPNHIWIYFDKTKEDSLITYLCRPVNNKQDASNKFSEAPDVQIFIPNTKKEPTNTSSQFDYKFSINDPSLKITKVKMDKNVEGNNGLYRYFFIDVTSKINSFTIAISVKETRFPFYESILTEFVNNLTFEKK